MLCPNCGTYTETEETVCPECGQELKPEDAAPAGGAQAIRQGKRAREAIRERAKRAREAEESRRRRRGGSRGVSQKTTSLEMPAVSDTREPTPPQETAPEPEAEFGPEEGSGEDDPGDRGIERRYRPVYEESGIAGEQAQTFAAQYSRRRRTRERRVNWMKLSLIGTAAAVFLFVGGWLFLTRTDAGQRMMARMGRDANSTALWAVGDEQLDRGDITAAITSFERARAQDEAEGIVDVDGLLLLGNAYEAAGMIDEAAALYEDIYTGTPSRTEAYIAHIRILRARKAPGDLAHAGELMRIAYAKTGDSSFSTQRSDLLPAPPEVDLTAGYYESKKYIAITSYQGFDVYYTFDANAALPEGGTKFTERVFLDEGIHNLRAVAVNGELVSDELRGTYKIIMPSPQTPRASLAPNAYKTRQRVRLKPGLDNENDDDIVIFYTVDGSPPDADSPRYTGEPFWLPTGRVVMKAVAVNKYGKVSNTLEIKYKIEAKPYPLSAWSAEETISGLRPGQTSMTDFQQAFGEGTLEGEVQQEGFETECRKYTWPWGYAVMNRTRIGWVLVELCIQESGSLSGPRGTNVGDTAAFVVGKFRDLGQVESESGNRGLYYTDDSSGKIWRQEDGSDIIRYRVYNSDGHWWQLDYVTTTGGVVKAIDLQYMP